MTLREVDVDGVRMRCLIEGDGPPLVLLHGFLVSHLEWAAVLPYLTRRYRCIAPDLPGHGGSDKPPRRRFDYSMQGYANAVAGLLRALAITPTHLCGHSMGGGIALALAADHADLVQRLVLVDAAVYPAAWSAKSAAARLPGLGSLIFKRLYGRATMRDYFRRDVWSGHPSIDLDKVDRYYDDFDNPEARAAAYATFKGALSDMAPVVQRIPSVRARTLVLWGGDDRIFPPRHAERLERALHDARLEVIDGACHAPNEEFPEQTARLLDEHLGCK